jgi:hypothetical protein
VDEFKSWCGLPNIHDYIDGTNIEIIKSHCVFPKDYYYSKLSLN